MSNYVSTGLEPPLNGWWQEGFEPNEFYTNSDKSRMVYMPDGEYRLIDGEFFKVEPGIPPSYQLTEKTGRSILEALGRIEKLLKDNA